jgi:methylated-DNA-[protein]-cysteine S-methyltransferase
MADYSVFLTAAGWMGLRCSSEGLQRVLLPRRSASEVHALLGPGALEDPDACAGLRERLRSYFSGRRADFPDVLDLSGATPFQRRVWEAARLIPHGETRSYRWLASQIGRPQAARAVGQALGKNPLPVIVPCHRVTASGGLGGFSGGIAMKKRLLKLEAGSARHRQNGNRLST